MKIGGFYDWNPFLLPLVLAVGSLLAYGPARLIVIRALLWGQGLLSHGPERLPAVSRASPPFRWSAFHVVTTAASALSLLLFIYMEQYYRIGGCALDERYQLATTALLRQAITAIAATQLPAWIELQSLHDGLHSGRLQPWVSRTHLGVLVNTPGGLDSVKAALAHGQLDVDARSSFLSVTSSKFPGTVCFVMLFSNTSIGGEAFLCATAQSGSSVCRSQEHILPLEQRQALGGVTISFPGKALALADLDTSRGVVQAVPTWEACWANIFG